ncbi:MAG: hypothetical protein HZY79_12225 [Rhodoblastus sp.]|nr:MAG: hypothetical protein HZY79_12225 [Rhodoblastus sp.]
MGPDAIQFLVDVYFDNPKARFNALIGLCRAGAPAAGAMEDIIGRLADLPDLYETSPSRRRLLAIAALRVGRPDLAQTIDEMSRRNLTSSQTEFPDPAPEEWPGDYAKIVATVSKESAPAVCDVKMNKWYD